MTKETVFGLMIGVGEYRRTGRIILVIKYVFRRRGMFDASKLDTRLLHKASAQVICAALSVSLLVGCSSRPHAQAVCPANSGFEVARSNNNPLLDINTMPVLGGNANGPSVIRVPDWIPDAPGKYYMYFSSHDGDHIKLAYTDNLTGPWSLVEGGTLQLSEATRFYDHIASPDVHVDDQKKQIRMYFHGPHRDAPSLPGSGQQVTGVALSEDGINFRVVPGILGTFYFRVFQYGGSYYAFAKNGNVSQTLYRSKDGLSDWERGIDLLPNGRHVAVELDGDMLLLYFSAAGDAPESILRAEIDLRPDWRNWEIGRIEPVIAPERDYEGGGYAVSASRFGAATGVRELRDPAVFLDNGRRYLFYTGAGEETINVAELVCLR